MHTVVVFGPPLPARDLLEHTLARALPAGTRVEVGDLPTVRDRRERAAALAAAGERAVFVAYEPTEGAAWRDVFHHYAGIPQALAELRWEAYLDDADRREPSEGEVPGAIVLHGGEPIDTVVGLVARVVGPGLPRAARAQRVLVVDDDPAQRTVLGEALTTLGCDVTTAASAEDALDRVHERPYDLVISDERMPGAAGTELADALSDVQPGLRVAIVTGYPETAAASLPRGPHVDMVLAKPVGIVDLLRVLEEMARH